MVQFSWMRLWIFSFFFKASLIFFLGGGVTILRNSPCLKMQVASEKLPFVEEELFTLV